LRQLHTAIEFAHGHELELAIRQCHEAEVDEGQLLAEAEGLLDRIKAS